MITMLWTCDTCQDKPEFILRDELVSHLQEKHDWKPGDKFKREFKIHMDASGGHSDVHILTALKGGYQLTEVMTERRRASRGVQKIHPQQKVLPLPKD